MSALIQDGIARKLRALTTARVGLAPTGVSQHTRDVLHFQLSHAQARDAVHARMDAAVIATSIADIIPSTVLQLHSAARDRAEYLQRPDLGRKLDNRSRADIAEQPPSGELAIIIADGLSALAVERHAVSLLSELLPRLNGSSWKLAPFSIVEQGRVAIGDEIGQALRAQLAVVLIGERPGLSSPDSLGVYITWQPRVGRTDAERICISNIRAEGLSYTQAAAQLAQTVANAREKQLTGVAPRVLTEG